MKARIEVLEVFALLVTLALPAAAQGPASRAGAPSDWSFSHLVYSSPPTRAEASAHGAAALAQWERLGKDPRFAAALSRREEALARAAGASNGRRGPPSSGDSGEKRDWSYVLGFTAGSSGSGVFPAKFTFDINATPSCAGDFVVHTTNALSAAFVAGTPGSKSGTFTGAPNNNQTMTIQSSRPNLVLVASTTLNTGTNYQIGANVTVTAANMAAAINRFGTAYGVIATSSAGTVTVTAMGPGNSGISLNENMGNFTWTGGNGALTGATGTAGQATVLAFNQMYSSCGAPYPAVHWSYSTGANRVANGSPVLSLDGTQVAFVETNGVGGAASLVVLKWRAGDGGVTTPVSLASSATYAGCAAPCMKRVSFGNGAANTNSDPFYDYASDVLYVGDDAGVLHKFTGVFFGEPAEATASPWPRTVSTGNKLSGPVYNPVNGFVYVGSAAGASTGGQLHAFDPVNNVLVNSGLLSRTTSGGVADPPIVDPNAARVYALVGADSGANTNAVCSGSPCMAVYQFDVAFSGGSLGTKQQVGRGQDTATNRQLLTGAFNNAYLTSGTPGNPSGVFYVCASQQNTTQRPTIWRVQITNNALAGATEGPRLVNANADCSPVTTIVNGAAEYLFASVTTGGKIGTCTGACLYMYNVNALTSAWSTGTLPNAELPVDGGTGGIIVDNVSPVAGASQIYFGSLASPGNAIQASQGGLQ